MQAPINSRLGKTVGGVQAATFSFLIGTAALVAISFILRGGLSSLGGIGKVPWWALVGGLLGAVYVFVALEAVRTLGASGLTAVVITGQLTIVGRDRPLRAARRGEDPVSFQRVLGIALLVAGVALVVRK